METVTISLPLHWVTFGLGVVVGWLTLFLGAWLFAGRKKKGGESDD